MRLGEVGLESKETISGLGDLVPNLALFVIHHQTMTHLFGSTVIIVRACLWDSLLPLSPFLFIHAREIDNGDIDGRPLGLS